MTNVRLTTLAAACGLLSSVCLAQNVHQVAIGPWTFEDGNITSRTMVTDTIRRICEHQGYTVLPQAAIDGSFQSMNPAIGMRGGRPGLKGLARYASAVQATHLIYGVASWHTRSIWVGTGPKTISTATIDLYVYNAQTGAITYKRKAEGRSDEKESVLKDVADVILTPLVTVVSGGPATPREQRAAQIALGRALRPWIQRHFTEK